MNDHFLSNRTNENGPTVSFGVPVFNGEQFLSRALDSLITQEFEDLEIVISDNCSTDSTQEICEAYARRDPRIKYFRLDKNYGAAYNYNNVFYLSSGIYFKWATHDDEIHPAFLTRCLELYERQEHSQPPLAIVYPKSVFVDDQGKVLGPDTTVMRATSVFPAARAYHAVQKMGMAAPVFGLFRRESLEKTRLIDSFIASDYVLMLELALVGKVVQVPEVLFFRRVHPQMSRIANTAKKDVLNWFDPGAKQRLPTRQKLLLEYNRSVWRNPCLNIVDKITCSVALSVGFSVRRLRVIQGQYRRKFVNSVRRTLKLMTAPSSSN